MSRVGKAPIPVVDGVKVSIENRTVHVEGPKGKLSFTHREEVSLALSEDGKTIVVSRQNDERDSRAYHGLTRALVNNMILGVKNGYEKRPHLLIIWAKGDNIMSGEMRRLHW